MPYELADGWRPFLQGAKDIHGLARIWAVAIGAKLGHPVTEVDVVRAIWADPIADPGAGPALARWRRVPPALRFVPPGLRPDRVDEKDIRMWLKVGALLERQYG
jgi:hypothetical protein